MYIDALGNCQSHQYQPITENSIEDRLVQHSRISLSNWFYWVQHQIHESKIIYLPEQLIIQQAFQNATNGMTFHGCPHHSNLPTIVDSIQLLEHRSKFKSSL